MTFALRDGLSFCTTESRTIFLDLSSGRYLAITNSQHDAFQRWSTADALANIDVDQLTRLVDQGILKAGDAAYRIEQPTITQPATRFKHQNAKSRWMATGSAVLSRLIWRSRLKRWPLQRIIFSLENLKLAADQSQYDPNSYGSIVRAFELADVLLGSHDRCMERSLALAVACRKQRLNCDLVLGVQADPFAAHCWVQSGNVVLNEEPDRVQMFMPILVA